MNISKARLVAIIIVLAVFSSCYINPEVDLSQSIPVTVNSLPEAMAWVANNIQYVDDGEAYGYENFQTPEETYRLRRGDCEDYALLLMYFAEEQLGMKTYLQLVGDEGAELPRHAIADIQGYWIEAIYGYGISKEAYKAFRKVDYETALKEIYNRGYVVIF